MPNYFKMKSRLISADLNETPAGRNLTGECVHLPRYGYQRDKIEQLFISPDLPAAYMVPFGFDFEPVQILREHGQVEPRGAIPIRAAVRHLCHVHCVLELGELRGKEGQQMPHNV